MRARYRPAIAGAAAIVMLAGSVSCGDVVRQGNAPVIIVVDSLQAASGAEPGDMGGFLLSDVQTLVDRRRRQTSVPHLQRRRQRRRCGIIPKDVGTGAKQPGSDALECGDDQPLSHHVHQG